MDTAPDRVSGAHASHASGIGRAAEGGSDLGAPRREGRNPERARRRSRDAKKPQSPTYPIQEHPRCHPEREPSSKARNSPWKMLLVSRWDEHSCYRGAILLVSRGSPLLTCPRASAERERDLPILPGRGKWDPIAHLRAIHSRAWGLCLAFRPPWAQDGPFGQGLAHGVSMDRSPRIGRC